MAEFGIVSGPEYSKKQIQFKNLANFNISFSEKPHLIAVCGHIFDNYIGSIE